MDPHQLEPDIYVYSFVFSLDTLCIWHIYVHIFSFCFDMICMVSLGVFCISFRLYRQLLLFLLLLSLLFSVWGDSVRFSAAYLNSWKMQLLLLLPLLLFTSKQFFCFSFLLPKSTPRVSITQRARQQTDAASVCESEMRDLSLISGCTVCVSQMRLLARSLYLN